LKDRDKEQYHQKRFRIIFNQTSDPFYITDLEGNFIDCNKAFEKLIGYSKEEIIDKSFHQLGLFSEKDIARAQRTLEKNKKKQSVGMEGYILIRKDNQKIMVEIFTCMADITGNKFILAIIRDITRRKKAEEKIKKYAEAIKFSMDGMAILNGKEEYVFLNDAHAKIYGYDSPEELIGKSWRFLYHQEEIKRFENEIMTKLREKGKWQGKAIGRKKDGSKFYQELSLGTLEDNGIICVVRDITQRKKEQTQLKNTLSELSAIYKNAPVAMMLVDSERKILKANGAAAKFAVRSPEEMIGMVGGEALRCLNALDDPRGCGYGTKCQDCQIRNAVLDTFKDGKNREQIEIWLPFPFGEERKEKCLLVSTALLQIDREDRVLLSVGDITERKMTEESVKQSRQELKKTLDATIETISKIAETRDPYTSGHQQRVSQLSIRIAREMHLSQEQIETIRIAALIHDIGKISIPSEILTKPGKLSDIEFSLIKSHSQTGYDILKGIDFPYPIIQIILQHHERNNGLGYPNRLTGDEILLEAKIIGVADVVEAMSSHRPYRPALGVEAALEEITKNKGILYDPEIVDVCVKLFKEKGFKFE